MREPSPRNFAAQQNSDSYLAATVQVEDAEAGMKKMSRVYNQGGRELYIG
ncbi:hypothetical protein [Erythrobacter sp.]